MTIQCFEDKFKYFFFFILDILRYIYFRNYVNITNRFAHDI